MALAGALGGVPAMGAAGCPFRPLIRAQIVTNAGQLGQELLGPEDEAGSGSSGPTLSYRVHGAQADQTYKIVVDLPPGEVRGAAATTSSTSATSGLLQEEEGVALKLFVDAERVLQRDEDILPLYFGQNKRVLGFEKKYERTAERVTKELCDFKFAALSAPRRTSDAGAEEDIARGATSGVVTIKVYKLHFRQVREHDRHSSHPRGKKGGGKNGLSFSCERELTALSLASGDHGALAPALPGGALSLASGDHGALAPALSGGAYSSGSHGALPLALPAGARSSGGSSSRDALALPGGASSPGHPERPPSLESGKKALRTVPGQARTTTTENHNQRAGGTAKGRGKKGGEELREGMRWKPFAGRHLYNLALRYSVMVVEEEEDERVLQTPRILAELDL